MALSGIEARHLRVEQLSDGSLNPKRFYDVIISRAFSAVAPFVRTVWPLLRSGGRVIALKGQVSATEMVALKDVLSAEAIGGSLEQVGYSIPGMTSERTLLIVRCGG
jgi:16S rRNA G527 N7-methylase RsmG